MYAGLKDRVVVITGAGQGIGRHFAQRFAGLGAIPVIAELDMARAERVRNEIVQHGGRALAVQTDVADAKSVDAMAARVMSEFGRFDVLVNNAAIFSTLKMRPFDQIPLEEWEQVMRVNVTGVFLCCKTAAPIMRRQRFGRIINMASAAVTMGRPNYLHYIASKSALIGMSRSLARELGADGVTVNSILPGATFTEVPRETVTDEQKARIVSGQCIPRPEAPSDLAGAALFLASDDSAFMTGQSLTVDGGNTHI
ncbi:MAG: SDR family NAD(P)-dependent oxidoreductase [Alphaproteobacteria bacterium]